MVPLVQDSRARGGDLFIVDNSESEWRVKQYLSDWCDIASSFDIATAYFEIGALLALDGQWQKLDHIRILMGDEVAQRTRRELGVMAPLGIRRLARYSRRPR